MSTRLPPVPEDLAKRKAAAPTVPYRGRFARPGDSVPDFATLFALAPCQSTDRRRDTEDAEYCEDEYYGCESCECESCTALLTPRIAYLLYAGAEVAGDFLADSYEKGVEGFTESGALPPSVVRFLSRVDETEARAWISRFLTAAAVAEARLACGEVPTPRSTAEEMVLHIVLNHAAFWVDLFALGHSRDVGEVPENNDPNWLAIAPMDDRDLDLDRVRRRAFADHDVLMLFEPELDGIEDDEVVSAVARFANLSPRDWFVPFRNSNPTGY